MPINIFCRRNRSRRVPRTRLEGKKKPENLVEETLVSYKGVNTAKTLLKEERVGCNSFRLSREKYKTRACVRS